MSELSQQLISRQKNLEARKADLVTRHGEYETKGWPAENHPAVKEFDRDLKRWLEDAEDLKWERERNVAGKSFMSKTNGSGGDLRGHDSESAETKAVTKTVSPLQIPVSEYKGLYQAMIKRLPSYRIDCNHFTNDVSTKAGAFAESGFSSGNLPPILDPRLFLDLPYEPDRAFSHFKQLTAPDARAVEYIQHTGNANPAAAVAELGTKPDLGMDLTTVTTPFVKIAAIASASMEVLQDEKTFLQWIPMELQRAIIDAETDEVVNGSGSSPHMLGILNASGTLTRAQSSDTVIDAIRKTINDIRVGSSFSQANLILVNPGDWADIQLQKSTGGLYLLNPTDPNSIGNMTELFGCTIVQNTYVPSGTLVVLDKNWVYAWTRHSLTIDINQFGSDSDTNYWTQNAVSFRCEERIAVGYARPTAINILTLS